MINKKQSVLICCCIYIKNADINSCVHTHTHTQDPKPLLLRLDLQLGAGDSVRVYDGLGEQAEHLLQSLTHHNNQHSAVLESSQGQMSILYHAKPHSQGHGFNASYQVRTTASFLVKCSQNGGCEIY